MNAYELWKAWLLIELTKLGWFALFLIIIIIIVIMQEKKK